MRVLIVEDDVSLAATLRESLEAQGFSVLARPRPTVRLGDSPGGRRSTWRSST
jgi:DNA-binding response OmpR family regulator